MHSSASTLKLPALSEGRDKGGVLISKAIESTLVVFLCLVGLCLTLMYAVKVDVTVDGIGTLEPVAVWSVRPKEAGIIEMIYVAEGDTVKNGQPLMRLDSLALVQAKIDLQHQYRHLALEKSRLKDLSIREANRLSEKKTEAQARQIHANAELRDQLVRFGYNTLLDSSIHAIQSGSHVGIDLALANARMADSQIRQTEIEEGIQGAKYIDMELFDVRMDQLQSQINAIEQRMTRLVIRSPGTGVVLTGKLERLVGAFVKEGASLIEIASINEWVTIFSVNENDVHKIHVGDSVKIRLNAFNTMFQELYTGRVSSVAGEPEQAPTGRQGYYRVEAIMDEESLKAIGIERLKHGYTIEGKVIVQSGRIIHIMWDRLASRA